MYTGEKIYVSEAEYSRLCRLDGRVDALVGYIQEEEKDSRFIDISTIKSIIGNHNFYDKESEIDV